MNDPFGVRERVAVDWLKFKGELGEMLTAENERLLFLVFQVGFIHGDRHGTQVMHDETSKIIEKVLGQ